MESLEELDLSGWNVRGKRIGTDDEHLFHGCRNETYNVQQIKDDYGYLKELRITNSENTIRQLEYEEQERKRPKRNNVDILKIHGEMSKERSCV